MPKCSACRKESPADELVMCKKCGDSFCFGCADFGLKMRGICSACVKKKNKKSAEKSKMEDEEEEEEGMEDYADEGEGEDF